ncbi:tyrosine-type recombinase/integrase [Sphingobium sp. CR2-8]|uniref:tyrosine-type recombinase/integrase n=1 Tax=Sphingobium sp. CR2-8 TaxID=1306534 RepID=UPI002DBA6FC6|nr:tyrosine-type recombinase/integrase [Sphingobium sp. CR2-8]MEC3911521.1 tyrosine-type recombinase/integrase [Sphingobium sp. CR2-8]
MIITKPLNGKNIRALLKGQKITKKGIKAEKLTDGAEGDVRYSINVMVDGERHHRIIGKASDGVKLTDAHKALETLRTRAREGRLDLPKGRKTHMSFAEAATSYLDRLVKTGGKGIHDKRRHLELRLIPYFKNSRLDRISEVQVQEYVQARLAAGIALGTANRELATLSHFLRRAAAWKWIKRDDIPTITKAAEPRKAITVLSDEEATLLMEAAQEDFDDLLPLFVSFGLNTPMRHGEILSVRFEHIDFESRRIFIPQAKAGEREQVITPSLAAALLTRRDQVGRTEGWVFPANGAARTGSRRCMWKQFKRTVERAGLSPSQITPHVMRHTAITNLVRAGVDLPTIQKISGHKTLAMVLRYTHVHGPHLDRAIAVLDRTPAVITQKLHTINSVDESYIALCS